jgi:hypothetical protein
VLVRCSTKTSGKHPGRQKLPANLPRVERVLACGGRPGTPNVRRKKEESSAKGGLHRAATLNQISAGLKR